jgi:hypothetical protein
MGNLPRPASVVESDKAFLLRLEYEEEMERTRIAATYPLDDEPAPSPGARKPALLVAGGAPDPDESGMEFPSPEYSLADRRRFAEQNRRAELWYGSSVD